MSVNKPLLREGGFLTPDSFIYMYTLRLLKVAIVSLNEKRIKLEIDILGPVRSHLKHMLALGLCFLTLPLAAQKPAGNSYLPPRAPLSRYLEDYSALDSLERNSPYLKVKYLPAGKDSYVSFGGETRQRYEYFHNYRLGSTDQDPNGFLTSRFLLHADFHLRDWFRLFTQLSYTDVYGRAQGSRYTDRDRLAVHQLFLDLNFSLNGTALSLQAGRREYSYGKSRWMGTREGPNTRCSFDGINIRIGSGLMLDMFYLARVDIGPESFDNQANWDQRLLGFHLSGRNLFPKNELDVYGFYFTTGPMSLREHAEKKYALGIRDKLVLPRLEADGELMLQLAAPDDLTRSALMLGLEMRVKPFQNYDKLTAGMDMLYTSGYRDDRSMTYQSLFPSHMNTRNLDLFGKHNLSYLEPFLWWYPSSKNKIAFETNVYLRSSAFDHVYSIPGYLLYGWDSFSGSYLGTQFSLLYTRYWTPFLFTELQYSRFQPSDGLTGTGAEAMDLLALVLTLKF